MNPELEIITHQNERSGIRRNVVAWLVVAVGSSSLVAGIFLAPILLSHGWVQSSNILYQSYGKVCHQIAARSFFFDGHALAVCARCSGLYIGFAVSAIAYPLFKPLTHADSPWRGWLFFAAAPCVIDFSLGFFNIWANTHFSRFATGALLGSVSVLYVMPGAVEISNSSFKSFIRQFRS